MASMKGGTGVTLVAVFLAATFAGGVSLAGLTSTFTNAFQSINLQSDVDFLKNYVAPNIKAGCRTDQSPAKFPKTTNISKKLDGISKIRIKQKDTVFGLGDKILNLQVQTNGGNKKNIRVDFKGAILDGNGWQCEGPNSNGNDKIRINYSNKVDGTSGTRNEGDWLDIPGDTIQSFRVLEENTDNDNSTEELMLQVYITSG